LTLFLVHRTWSVSHSPFLSTYSFLYWLFLLPIRSCFALSSRATKISCLRILENFCYYFGGSSSVSQCFRNLCCKILLVVPHKLLFWIHHICASGGTREGLEVFLTLGVIIIDEACVDAEVVMHGWAQIAETWDAVDAWVDAVRLVYTIYAQGKKDVLAGVLAG
jgi:hypothetical protein